MVYNQGADAAENTGPGQEPRQPDHDNAPRRGVAATGQMSSIVLFIGCVRKEGWLCEMSCPFYVHTAVT